MASAFKAILKRSVMTPKSLIILGILLVFMASSIVTTITYLNSSKPSTPLVYSNNAMLYELWNEYKANDLDSNSGRTIDHSISGNTTTSEGESYTLLRAVWQDDQSTFNKSLLFSTAYMQRADNLFSWKYGELSDGKYGINTSNGDYNTASDADTDIALALLMAYSRWNEAYYLEVAQPIITSIWNEEVVSIQGQPVMTADNLERNSNSVVVVNPSYFNPAAYKIFAKVDPGHDWLGLANNSYTILNNLSQSKLGSSSSSGLPPNWVGMDQQTGAFVPDTATGLNTDYGYDAFRIPFNLALDYEWFHDQRDLRTLGKFSFLETTWNKSHMLNATYAHSGSPTSDYESPAMYGASFGYFMLIHPQTAKVLYNSKLVTLYNPDTQGWKDTMNYYNDNWAWFGLALAQGALPNLTLHT